MRRVGVLLLTGVVLVGSVMAGCATSEPVGRADASASPSPSSQVDLESGAATPGPSLSNSLPIPSTPAGEGTGSAETPRPESGRSPHPVKSPSPAGVSLSELAAMVIDPFEEMRKAGMDIEIDLSVGRPFHDTFAMTVGPFSPIWSRVGPWNSGPSGLVVGYSRGAYAENMVGDAKLEGERGEFSPSLSASVLAFDSKAHAREYLEDLERQLLDQADKPVRAGLPAAGNGVVLWRSGSGRHFRDVALIRRGNLVGEVVTAGFTTDGHGEAIEPLARALADQMAQVKARARPYDAAAVLAAPLPIEAWSVLDDGRSSYSELVDCSGECEEEFMWGPSWVDVPADSSYLHLAFGDEDGYPEDYPITGTDVIAFDSEAEASDAMGDIVARWLAREGGEKFAVPGIPGAVGVRTGTPYDIYDPSDNDLVGYTWNVFFTHGSALARAFVAGGTTDDEDFEDPADSERNKQWVIDAAQAWQPRLDVILG